MESWRNGSKALLVWVFQKQLISWDFHTKQSLEQSGRMIWKTKKYPINPLSDSAVVDERRTDSLPMIASHSWSWLTGLEPNVVCYNLNVYVLCMLRWFSAQHRCKMWLFGLQYSSRQLEQIWSFFSVLSNQQDVFTQRTAAHWSVSVVYTVIPGDSSWFVSAWFYALCCLPHDRLVR